MKLVLTKIKIETLLTSKLSKKNVIKTIPIVLFLSIICFKKTC